MDGNTVLLLIALMLFAGVVLVNVVIAGTVLRLEHYRTERDRAGGGSVSGTPRAANLYVAALLVSGVPLVAFFGAVFGSFSAGGWAYVAAGAATVGAIVGAVNLCAVPSSGGDLDETDEIAHEAAQTADDTPPTLSVVTIEDEPAENGGEDNDEERRTPDDANG